ncbi:aldose 1-epimerase family protein [Blautia liquoris]|uniref:Aldose 1-epimerase family protein n=1 Tax=Blautia liquoris TaxID=2779518 RepID=A0A7M2RE51_9FIRM|nr:aldose 1-epimerase family protein [Blautia liquoris]QOV18244.1 aldose 1-epimerase family protein [Blautia liquoris]
MNYRIFNEKMSVMIHSKGAELNSIRKGNTEYLWQGDPAFWEGQAPNLFPYVGRMTDKSYTYQGNRYQMDIHGFVKDYDLTVCDHGRDYITFCLDSDHGTMRQYPFSFTYLISYRLEGSRLEISYEVTNRDDKRMYFGIGGHPGFRVPICDGEKFEDYSLKFQESVHPLRIGFSPTCFVDNTKTPFELGDDNCLNLKHNLFDQDAVVLEGAGDTVILLDKRRHAVLSLNFPDMPYLGIWHTPKMDAPFICLEPWASLPSSQGVVEELTMQKSLIMLDEGKTYVNDWSISITG